MSNRLDTDRQETLEPSRMKYAIDNLEALGFEVTVAPNKKSLQFIFNGHWVQFFPYSGWHTGKSICDGRGLQNLLNQLI